MRCRLHEVIDYEVVGEEGVTQSVETESDDAMRMSTTDVTTIRMMLQVAMMLLLMAGEMMWVTMRIYMGVWIRMRLTIATG